MSPDRADLLRRLRISLGAEIEQQIQSLEQDLLELERDPDDFERVRAVFRVFHTLKGAASAAGVPAIERLCHAVENRLVPIRDRKSRVSGTDADLMLAVADLLGTTLTSLRDGGEPEPAPLVEMQRRILAAGDSPVQVPERAPSAATPAPARPTPSSPATPSARNSPRSNVRLEAERLDALYGEISDLLVSGSRLQPALRDLRELHDRWSNWAMSWRQLSTRMRRQDGEAITADRRLLGELDEQLRQLVRDSTAVERRFDGDVRAVSGVHERLSRSVHQLRLDPFSSACESLPRVVRDLTADGIKQVNLEIDGGSVTADRAILEALRDPLVQLLRNAIDHGIEPVSERVSRGKPGVGSIRVAASIQLDRLMVEVSDDGSGIDVAALRAAAARHGIELGDDDRAVAGVLLGMQGVSSRSEATATSGRGVGLDIVRTSVTRLGGVVSVSWSAGRGTTFTIDLPVSLASQRSLVVQVGSHPVAIPVRFVDRLMRVRVDELDELQGRQVVPTEAGVVPVVSLAELLGPPYSAAPVGGSISLIVSSTNEYRVALAVDALVEERELVIRLLDGERQDVGFAGGMTQLPDGSIAPVLRMPTLLAAAISGNTAPVRHAAGAQAEVARRRIVVVDDSITTRTLEQALLEAAGYEVYSAVDGAEAWRLLQERGADLVVADVEMPRMDGFALCEAIRASPRFRELPVILVTARESQEDLARGLEAGANAYLGKSSFDQGQLLDLIAELLG